MLAVERTNVIDGVGGDEGQAGQRRKYAAAAVAPDRVRDGRGGDERCQRAQQPAVGVSRPEDPGEGHRQQMEQGRIVAGVEGVDLDVLIRPAPLAEIQRIDQLKAFALVVIKRELNQIGGVGQKDDQVAGQQQQGDNQQGPLQ